MPKRIAKITSFLIIAFAVLVLLGWQFNIEALKKFYPTMTAMNPVTALVFIIAACFIQAHGKVADKFLKGLALVVILIAADRLFSYLIPSSARVDQWLFHKKLDDNAMSPNTAVNFIFLGFSMLFFKARSKLGRWVSQALIVATLIVSLTAFLGYLYGVNGQFRFESYIPMALHTTILFILLAIGLLSLKTENRLFSIFIQKDTGGLIARLLLPLAVFVNIGLGEMGFLGQRAGFYGPEMRLVLTVVFNVIIFTTIIWFVANVISEIDRKRKDAELALQKAHDGLETQVEERTAELKQIHRQLVQQERLRALGEMASGIAHDFNNALTPILGYTELMLSDEGHLEDKEKKAEHLANLKIIHTAAKDAATIVSRLRQFGRPREEGAFGPVDLNRLIEQAIKLTQPKWQVQAMAKGVEITVEMDLEEVGFVEGDEQQLREALTNLIFNAVDAMNTKGSICFKSYRQDDRVVMKMSDTGLGMTEAVRQKCLEPFFTTKGDKGTGLGLSMVYGIIQRHRGDIEVQSEPGKGTTFLIRLPIAKSAGANCIKVLT